MLKKTIIHNLNNTFCKLKTSKISGVGVFAFRDIPNGINPFNRLNDKWIKIKKKDLKKLNREVIKLIGDFFTYEKNGDIWVLKSGLNGLNISFYLNNSDKPNLFSPDDGQSFRTLRKIKKGEELTISYSNFDHKWKNN